MKKLSLLLSLVIIASLSCNASPIEETYRSHCQPSHISQHLPQIKKLAIECSSALVLGVEGGSSTIALLYGLSENTAGSRSYLAIDENQTQSGFNWAQELAQANNINCTLRIEDEMKTNIEDVPTSDLLFIDSIHTYCRVLYQLKTFSPKTTKYIVLHDTSSPWGNADEPGDKATYPADYDRTKKGVLPAVQDFLKSNPAWKLHIRYFNNHGLVVLKRVSTNKA